MPKNLQEWLSWQETLHPSEIDLGLQRVTEVLHRILPHGLAFNAKNLNSKSSSHGFNKTGLTQQDSPTVITIAGTNGKGSTVAMLESIFTQAGYRVGSYTSPHLLKYNERIKINQAPVSDELICDSFECINQARLQDKEQSLTYFEFATLAAIEIFHRELCQIIILEVGLGGRLDAVNIIDADVALVTTVDLDHQDWLGSDRNAIGIEKAGIYRSNKPAIYGDADLPQSIRDIVEQDDLNFYQYSIDYHFSSRKQEPGKTQPFEQLMQPQWDWIASSFPARYNLPIPSLQGEVQLKNASNALMVLNLLKDTCPVTQAEIKLGLQGACLAGRFQVVSSSPLVVLDVAHNVQAAQTLKASVLLLQKQRPGKLHVIIGMLKDKDVSDVLSVMAPYVSSWRLIQLNSSRAMPAQEIKTLLTLLHKKSETKAISQIQCFDNFEQAYKDYSSHELLLNPNDILLVFGSFFTVTEALQFFQLSDKMINHE
ncbi:MAG: bifunctional folylpolyglutamate synthase/dihydrofolate synthase [Gammaproteobacteria bacterium]|nr:bifunctional folylpolyglutamate synthase/dihydrofolate synthase [Gammaproteobacteria bacterium]